MNYAVLLKIVQIMPHKRLVFINNKEELSYRIKIMVNEYAILNHDELYPICPRCKHFLEREYMQFCNSCGQKLCWDKFSRATEKKYIVAK